MKASVTVLLLSLAVVSLSMAGDLKDDLLAMEKRAWTAWAGRDGKAFLDMLTEDAVQAVAGGGVTSGRAAIIAGANGNTCEVKGFEFSDSGLRRLSPEIVILTYTATQNATCEGQKLPPKVFVTSMYVRQGGQWRSTSYQETAL